MSDCVINKGIYLGSVIFYAVSLSLSASENNRSNVYVPDNGMSHANQIITEENESRSVTAAPSPEKQKLAGSAPTVFDDITLSSHNTVTYNSLGLIIRNYNLENVSVAIHDSKGRLVFLEKFGPQVSTINVPTDGFMPGAYIYSVRTGERVLAKSFIVAH